MELKLNWINHCVLSANSNKNNDADPNSIIFAIKERKFYTSVLTLSEKDKSKAIKISYQTI